MSRITTTLAEIRQIEPAYAMKIPAEFLDENSHVNVQYYLRLVERGMGQIFAKVGMGEIYAAADVFGNFALEQHIRYLSEILVNEHVSVHIRLLELREKRAYFMGFLVNDAREQLAATVELVMMNVDIRARRGAPFPPEAFAQLEAMRQDHASLPWAAPLCGIMRA